ncbi:alpha-1,2-mannosidase, putative [Raineyella antarctica]|uniref:Alpha-1,2-mannosidase, putative n=1 Tax=Raineyella antarctica TaxID=1577474 RepID=A0A1G6GN74_9ACTN|nr:glycoside hydrolase domain-containing protein [Raineyella antarctica]SDB83421.1 alpha-1,2-mannosidase, putative [Raineyella antarctica]
MVTRSVDPFIGCEPTDLAPRTGIAATWWSPKPQIGNTHPGATFPLGMVSAAPYSGAYPTGYGRYDLCTEGVPEQLFEHQQVSGITHFQQSGTGAIRRYYNYFRVTPTLDRLDDLGRSWRLHDEEAAPGWYAATLDSGIRFEVTVGPRSAVHRFTFPAHHDARVIVDFSHGGLQIPFGGTFPLRAALQVLGPGRASGEVVMEGAPLAAHLECTAPRWRTMLWYDHRLMPGGSRLDFSSIRPTTLRPFGIMCAGPTTAGQVVELLIGFSLRGTEQAERNLRGDLPDEREAFESRRSLTVRSWNDVLDRVRVDAPSAERQTVFDTALYHSLVKPCLAPGESPFWPSASDGPFAFDICTMWDIYRTQLPLLTTVLPERAVELATALITISEEEGNLPIGYRMAKGTDRFSRQGSALAHTFLADLCQRGLPGIDWDWVLTHLQLDLRRGYGEDYLRLGEAHPLSHTLDLATGYWCTARIAERLGDTVLAPELDRLADGWRIACDEDGLLRPSTYYEGTHWNYSFRLLPDMAGRIALAGGDAAFVALLDRFFGYGQPAVTQPGVAPGRAELAAGAALGRFQGLNNEPDMDAPWAYTYAGRPDRTAEVVHAVVNQQFGTGRGGLPGNDDSGGLSSWYVWAALGLFPVAGQNRFLLHPPAHAHARIDLGDTDLTIDTRGFRPPEPDRPPQYVAAVTLDGRRLTAAWIDGSTLHRGGELVVDLVDHPTDWATARRPPSASTSKEITP